MCTPALINHWRLEETFGFNACDLNEFITFNEQVEEA